MECCRHTRGVRPVSELGWESADQVVAGDPAAYVLLQQFGDCRDGGRAGACFLDGNGPGDRQIVDGGPPVLVLASTGHVTGRRNWLPAALVDQISHQLIAVDFDDVRTQVRASERQVETPAKAVAFTREYQRQAGDLREGNRPGRNCRPGAADQTELLSGDRTAIDAVESAVGLVDDDAEVGLT